MRLPLVIVVAVAENGVIGRDNALPWRLSTDLKHFKALTIGKPMIVGRRNWEAIGRPLPGRETVVISRQPGYVAPGAMVVPSWEAARETADAAAARMSADAIIVAGGAEIYRIALPETDRIHLTRVHAIPTGEVFFPDTWFSDFRETARESHPPGPKDQHAFTFIDLVRATGCGAGGR